MAQIVSLAWQKAIVEKIETGQVVDVTTGFTKAIQWLIETLSRRNISFTLYNVGAGVKRVTTETDKCPCCKRLL